MSNDLCVNLAGLKLENPTLTCSGTCGYAFEYADFMDLSRLGGFVTKSITREERPGNEPARVVEVRAGMLNAIGLANVGLDRFLKEKVPLIQKMQAKNIKVTGGAIDGDTATLLATGKDGDATSNGTITMVREGGAWKVAKESWKTKSE